jgi:hypothetical protein
MDYHAVWPSKRLVFHRDHFLTLGQLRQNVVNRESVKLGQVQFLDEWLIVSG